MWNTLKKVGKFTEKSRLDQIVGAPLFQLEDRPAYYYGGGFVVYYTSRTFRVEGIQRVEYGGPGEYAVGLYHFPDAAALKMELGLESFEVGDAVPLEGEILAGVTYASTYREVQRQAVDGCGGETRRLVDGEFKLLRQFIEWGPFELYFYGKTPKTKLGGFRYVFPEQET